MKLDQKCLKLFKKLIKYFGNQLFLIFQGVNNSVNCQIIAAKVIKPGSKCVRLFEKNIFFFGKLTTFEVLTRY